MRMLRQFTGQAGCALVGASLLLLPGQQLTAGLFDTDFNSGIPLGMTLYGAANNYDHSTGGVGGSGVLKLTEASASSGNSTAIVEDFDSGAPIAGFDATFMLYIGSGNGADGFSFVFGDFADSPWAEEGPGTVNGLTIAFDVYNNGGTPAEAPAIDIKWNNQTVYHRLVGATGATTPASPIGTHTTIRTQTAAGGAPVYAPVKIHVDPDGTLDLVFTNVVIVTNFPVFRPFTEAPVYGPAFRFGVGARTGGSYDAHWVDNLRIETYPVDATSGQPSLVSLSPQPAGLNAGAAGGVEAIFTNNTYSIVPGSVTMRYNNTTVTPTVTETDGRTRIYYGGANGLLPTGAATVEITYETTSVPAFKNTFTYRFVVDPFSSIPASFSLASVDTSKPGFLVRSHQMVDWIRSPGQDRNQLIQAERELALGYIDPATGQPYPNTADMSAADPEGYLVEPGVINYNGAAPANAGYFTAATTPAREDQPFPGIGAAGNDNMVVEWLTILELKAGGHRFGFRSDDGFRISFGPGFDAAGTVIVPSRAGGDSDTLFDVFIPQDGFYPVRISYWNGTGGVHAEFYYINPVNGQRILVNDPENLAAPRAYQASTVSRPSISRALPVQNWIGASPDEDVVIDITDGAIPLTASSVTLAINGVQQTVSTSKNGKVTTIRRDSSLGNLLPPGLNTIRLVYGFNEGGNPVTLTNTYQFTVAPYYAPVPAANRATTGVVTAEPGFQIRVHQIDKSLDRNQGNGARINGGGDSNRMPWPEVQLIEGNINPTNGLPYPNLATESSPGSWSYTAEYINWAFNAELLQPTDSGWFRPSNPPAPLLGARDDGPVPGFPGAGTSPAPTATSKNYQGLENGIIEITTYLELTRGAHIFGFNSDDGFIAISAPNVNDTLGTLVGFFNGGRGNSATMVAPVGQNPPQIVPFVASGSTLFSVLIPEDGIYPFRILFWQGGTGFNAEFFSINATNGAYVLVGDTVNGGIPAYRTYNGPAKPYVKFSISPTPWDNAVQQVGPGPITMVGRTRNAVNSSDLYNFQNTTYPSRPWANVGIGGVIGNGTSDPNIQLLLNGQVVPATKTTSGTDVTVVYQPDPPLPSGSTNTASLVYAGTTNSWTFIVQTYGTLNPADALPLASADTSKPGFKVKMAQTASITGFTQNTVARAEAQLAGILGPNVAIPGPEADGSYIFPNYINWTNNGVPQGNFQRNGYDAGTGWPNPFVTDDPFPGVPGTGRSNTENVAAEVFAYLAFPTNGYYRLGVNSDDGFALSVATPGVTNGMVLKSLDVGKGSSDVPVSFIVAEPGLYPIRLVYYNGGTGGALEFFSYGNDGKEILINDPNNPAAIKAYYALASVVRPNITSATTADGNITIIWVNGGTLESATNLNGPWTSTGDSDGSFTEPAAGAMKFYRVKQ